MSSGCLSFGHDWYFHTWISHFSSTHDFCFFPLNLHLVFLLNFANAFVEFQVISLGDTIKFSLSPTKTRDRMSTNVPGVPLDERNLVSCNINL